MPLVRILAAALHDDWHNFGDAATPQRVIELALAVVVEAARPEALHLSHVGVGDEDGDVDNDGDMDDSDKFLMKRRKAIKKAMAKEGFELPDYVVEAIEEVLAEDEDFEVQLDEAEDLDASSASKALDHDCAKHVVHKEHGEGQCIPGMHTLEEDENNPGTGYVTHYDVMFGDKIVEDVPVEELEIVSEMHHGHPKKKKK